MLLVGAGLGALLLVATVVVVLATSIMGDTVTPEEVRQWPVYRQQNFPYTVRLPAEPSWDPPRLIGPVQRSLNSRSCEHRGRSIGLTVFVLYLPSYGGPGHEFSYSAGVEGVRKGTGGTVLWQGAVKIAGQSGYGYTMQAGNRYFSGRMIPAWPADGSRLVYVLEFNDYSEGDKEGVEEYFASFRLK
ncbi:MAG: hypothetical protein IPP14_14605 [Planctomycetes bacterium]|nr:hypothetical protein [Planctomycetota bacterium]